VQELPHRRRDRRRIRSPWRAPATRYARHHDYLREREQRRQAEKDDGNARGGQVRLLCRPIQKLYQRQAILGGTFILDNCFRNGLTWPQKFEEKGAILVIEYDDIRPHLSPKASLKSMT
jgi:hypothetical protein